MSCYHGYNDESYFTGNPNNIEQIAWEYGMLRYGDQLPAIGYALGIESFEECKEILGFKGNGQVLYPIRTAKEQLELLWENKKRIPSGVLEIGGGRGEISIGLSHLGITISLIEPSESVDELLQKTRGKFGIQWLPALWNYSLGHCMDMIKHLSITDTVILCETIEHIEKDEFDEAFLEYIKPMLQKQHGFLIITNWINFHPIPIDLPWHVRRVDDRLYDWLAEGGKIVYRRGSHLVVRY